MDLLEQFILNCMSTYKKNKKEFSIVVTPSSSEDCWTLLQRKIKMEFHDLLEDVDEADIAIKPTTHNTTIKTIKDEKIFNIFLESVPMQKGLKNIKFTIEICMQLNLCYFID